MRQIKFRGKMLDGGRWIYGSLLTWPDGETYILYDRDFATTGTMSKDPVRPETVGQYTGLKDRNGKEVYEGDILDSLKGKFVIGWGNEHCGFEVLQSCRGKLLYLSDLYKDMTASEDTTEYEPDKSEWEWSVIGNVYDRSATQGDACQSKNPELIEE